MSNILRRTADVSWPLNSGWGNHRAVVRVNSPCNAVVAVIEWRRRDLEPEKTGIRVKHLETGKEIRCVRTIKSTRKEGKIVFKAPYEGIYGIYYMPFKIHLIDGLWYFPEVQYMKAEETAFDSQWEESIGGELPEAELVAIESRTDFDRFDPMEVPATDEEMQKLKAENPGEDFLVFPEDRINSIRMLRELPQRWIEMGPGNSFKGTARPGEYYVFQIGVWALNDLPDLQVKFEQVNKGENGKLPDIAFTCFNTEGNDWLGRSFIRKLNVETGSVQPLWFGVDLTENAYGIYEFNLKMITSSSEKTVHVALTVEGKVIPDRGDGDLWRLSRLRWLNSSIGIDGDAAKGYLPVEVKGNIVSCLGREVCFDNMGLPSAIRSFYSPAGNGIINRAEEIISKPVEMRINSEGKVLKWLTDKVQVKKVASGRVSVNSNITSEGLNGHNQTIMEYDGHIDTVIKLTATRDINIDNLELLVPIRTEVAAYMMGMGKEGGIRPAEWRYEWNIDRINNLVWIGSPHAGLQIKLKHAEDVWEMFNYRKTGLPDSWSNGGKGGCLIIEKDGIVLFDAFTGSRILKSGESLTWRFSLLVTPLRPVDTDSHWNERYHHIDTNNEEKPSLEEASRVGATVVNLHQGGILNPYLNYPFLKSEEMREQTDRAHQLGLRYKIYYTVRELSSRAEELWMLRSLGDEVLREGPGFHLADHFSKEKHHLKTGGPWLCEHLVEGFIPAWQQLLADGDYDSAIAVQGLSRWHNHYLEGLAWLIREVGIDGLYLDSVGYDRQVMKRVRKAMDNARENCLIDLHDGCGFDPKYGMNNAMNFDLELMPSINSLWFGEGYDYEGHSPDYWLTEISGIPFGLMGDMLQKGGNQWRGMVFGMTCRYGWNQGGNPVPVWQLWESFGMAGCRMYGWWNEGCPVSTDSENVKATVYIKPERTLVAIASWADDTTLIDLKINWTALGLQKEKAKIEVPYIENFQPEKIFAVNEKLRVEPGRGWLLILSDKM